MAFEVILPSKTYVLISSCLPGTVRRDGDTLVGDNTPSLFYGEIY